jgi:mannose-1-phosphate guanylyltransferase
MFSPEVSWRNSTNGFRTVTVLLLFVGREWVHAAEQRMSAMDVMVAEDLMAQAMSVSHSAGEQDHRWAVILAGGDGTRLKPLTRLACGDNRPKQFCPLVNGETLLSRTRERIAGSINPGQTLFVLTKQHKPYFAAELADVPAQRKIVQPGNQGTLPAILWSLLRLMRLDPNATVAFFPSDHHFTDEGPFLAALERSFALAERSAESVILLGAAADRPEIEYGWIEPESSVEPCFGSAFARVKRFWEKPSLHIARELYARRCLWNTFVMTGRVAAFAKMIRESLPTIFERFDLAFSAAGKDDETASLSVLYGMLTPLDFSRQVLSANQGRLFVASCGNSGWSDLGDPRRLARVIMNRDALQASDVCTRCGLSAKQISQLRPSVEAAA